jgi:hypothetical protein
MPDMSTVPKIPKAQSLVTSNIYTDFLNINGRKSSPELFEYYCQSNYMASAKVILMRPSRNFNPVKFFDSIKAETARDEAKAALGVEQEKVQTLASTGKAIDLSDLRKASDEYKAKKADYESTLIEFRLESDNKDDEHENIMTKGSFNAEDPEFKVTHALGGLKGCSIRLRFVAFCVANKSVVSSTVKSLFRSAGVEYEGDLFLEIGGYYASVHPEIANDPDMIKAAKENLWLKYHSNISASAELSRKMFSSFPVGTKGREQLEKVIGNDGVKWFQEATNEANTFDRKIQLNPNSRLLAFVYAYLSATKSLPEQTWWQGEKAVASMNALEYGMILNSFKKIVDLKKEESAIDYVVSDSDALATVSGSSTQDIEDVKERYLVSKAVPAVSDVEKAVKELVKDQVDERAKKIIEMANNGP